MAKETVEICANCGTVSRKESKSFRCPKCGCEVSVVVSREIFQHLVEQGLAREEK